MGWGKTLPQAIPGLAVGFYPSAGSKYGQDGFPRPIRFGQQLIARLAGRSGIIGCCKREKSRFPPSLRFPRASPPIKPVPEDAQPWETHPLCFCRAPPPIKSTGRMPTRGKHLPRGIPPAGVPAPGIRGHPAYISLLSKYKQCISSGRAR